MAATIRWVIFDLGGVLLEVKQQNIFENLSKLSGLPAAQVRELLGQHRPLTETFGVQEFSHSEVAVIEAINSELGSPIAGTERVLSALKPHVKLACLSNTNSVHWRELQRSYAFMQYLDVALASQRLGCAKPDAQIYTKANEMLGAAPHELLFFDDKVENVQAATAQGWNARVCSSVATMIVGLREFGFTL
jgi:putative hydrolase of the HAD superfamily